MTDMDIARLTEHEIRIRLHLPPEEHFEWKRRYGKRTMIVTEVWIKASHVDYHDQNDADDNLRVTLCGVNVTKGGTGANAMDDSYGLTLAMLPEPIRERVESALAQWRTEIGATAPAASR